MQEFVFNAVDEPMSLVDFSAKVDIFLVLEAEWLVLVCKTLVPFGYTATVADDHALQVLAFMTIRQVKAHGDFANYGNFFNEDLLSAHILLISNLKCGACL